MNLDDIIAQLQSARETTGGLVPVQTAASQSSVYTVGRVEIQRDSEGFVVVLVEQIIKRD